MSFHKAFQRTLRGYHVTRYETQYPRGHIWTVHHESRGTSAGCYESELGNMLAELSPEARSAVGEVVGDWRSEMRLKEAKAWLEISPAP